MADFSFFFLKNEIPHDFFSLPIVSGVLIKVPTSNFEKVILALAYDEIQPAPRARKSIHRRQGQIVHYETSNHRKTPRNKMHYCVAYAFLFAYVALMASANISISFPYWY